MEEVQEVEMTEVEEALDATPSQVITGAVACKTSSLQENGRA